MCRGIKYILLGLVCLVGVNSAGCHSTYWRSRFYLPSMATIDKEASFIKCHTADGHVLVLSDWHFDQEAGQISGSGIHYDGSRLVVERGRMTVPYRHVLVLEASEPEKVFNGYKGISMGVLTGLSFLLTFLLIG